MIGDLFWRARPLRAGAPARRLERALEVALHTAALSVHPQAGGLEQIMARTMRVARRRADQVRVGEVVVRDPEPGRDREVRWRVTARPKAIKDGAVIIVDYTDLDRPGERRIAWCDADTLLWAVSAGGAQ